MGVECWAVGFLGLCGITYGVAVDADSVFAAAVRGLAKFQRQPWLKAELTLSSVLVVQPLRGSRVYRVEVRRLLAWFDGSGPDHARRF